MTDEKTDPDPNLDPDDQGEGEGEDGEGEEPTLEEVIAERDELKRRLDRQRTKKAREARAANRAGAKSDPKPDDDEAAKLAEELAAERERNDKLEAKANKATALGIAAELGFRKPSHAVAIMNSEGDIEDAGDEDEVRAALRQILKDDPSLKKSAQRADGGEGGGAGTGRGSSTDFNDVIRRAAGKE